MTVRRWLGAVFAAAVLAGAGGLLFQGAKGAGAEDTQLVQAAGQHPFDPIAAVLEHPRCMNCHPRSDTPANGDAGQPHRMNITRGADGLGAPGARCYACHREENSETTFVPGAPHWGLAPRSMGWRGLDRPALCATLKDQSLNGDRDIDALVHHMSEDPLVLWGWNPGRGRAPVPVPHETFVKQLEAWAAAGAPCPTS